MRIRKTVLDIFIMVIASMPYRLLYLFSNFLTFINLHFIKYRKPLVIKNLAQSFPEKSSNERQAITKQFYRNLSDLVVEVLKSTRMSEKDVQKRVTFKNQEVIKELYEARRNVLITLGHCGNWEWVGNKIALFLKHEGAAIYKPIHDKYFNELLHDLRQKYKGTLMIDYKKVFRTLVSLKDQLLAVYVLADQSPARTEMRYFTNFLGQKTAFYDGMEKVARALDYAVVYLDITRVKRGFYEVEVITITDHAKQTRDGYIASKYVELLEASIRNQPDNWLWSHNRWKNKEEKAN